jgi:hypothetical protein
MPGWLPTSDVSGERRRVIDLHAAQLDLCRRFDAAFTPTPADATLGLALPTLRPGMPVHGVRHVPRGAGSGWLIWAGDLSSDPDFFQTIPVSGVSAHAPLVLPYLGLPPGWRFLLTPAYEDAWLDPTLLDR